jgi:hypothetical protein
VLDGLVKDGTITQAQEDAIIKALQAAKPAMGQGPGGGGRFGGLGRLALGFGLDEAAKALGITTDELRAELQTKTIAQIAAEHKIDLQQVINDLTTVAKSQLDAAVKAGKLTQAEADARLKDLTSRINDFVNQKLPLPDASGQWHRGGPGKPGAPGDQGGGENGSNGSGNSGSAPTTTTS